MPRGTRTPKTSRFALDQSGMPMKLIGVAVLAAVVLVVVWALGSPQGAIRGQPKTPAGEEGGDMPHGDDPSLLSRVRSQAPPPEPAVSRRPDAAGQPATGAEAKPSVSPSPDAHIAKHPDIQQQKVFTGPFGAEVVHGSWIISRGKSYEEAAAEIGADKNALGIARWLNNPNSQDSLRLVATIDKTPGVKYRMALPTRGEDELRAVIAQTGDYYDTGLREFVVWSLYSLLPAVQGDETDYYNMPAERFAASEPGQFLDVGCNAGWATLVAVSLGARGTCVEPNPRLQARLRMSRALGIEDEVPGTMLLVPGGADRVSGVGNMEFATSFGMGTLLPRDESNPQGKSDTAAGCKGTKSASGGNKWCFRVNTYSLDDVLLENRSPLGAAPGELQTFLQQAKLDDEQAAVRAELNAATFEARLGTTLEHTSTEHIERGPPIAMKIDIEGMEPEALRGMQRLLRSGRVKAIRSEFNPHHLGQYGGTGVDLLSILYDAGFVIFFHEAKSKEFYTAYTCEPGWTVPTVHKSAIAKYIQTAYPGPLQDVNSDVTLLHSSLADTITPALARKLYGSFPISSIHCDH